MHQAGAGGKGVLLSWSKDKIIQDQYDIICETMSELINTGNSILYWICYGCLMVSIVGAMQSVLLYVLSKYYKKR